ncbi:MAG: helix-turn-helix transcriptional regulator [Clostridia bacterium]|nr:helix-turn-helix transcriptional regulator [Clostridia bacterium]
MEETLGRRIANLRRAAAMTQDELAEKVGISAQAVSKWENDQTCPDITLLPSLAKIFGVTVDELLSGKQAAETHVQVLPENQRKDIRDMMLRMKVDTGDGDKVRISVPMALVQVAVETGMAMPQVSGNAALQNIDFAQILAMVEKGVMGNLMEVEVSDGTTVHIYVE